MSTCDDIKILEERHFKISKEMKDILWILLKRVNYNKDKMKQLFSFSITTLKFKAYFDICDHQLGYVARITRSREFPVPSSLSEISDLLRLSSIILIVRMMIMSNVKVLSQANPEVDFRTSLKRPYNQDDSDFVRSIKQNTCATTPEEPLNSRFKSISNKEKIASLYDDLTDDYQHHT